MSQLPNGERGGFRRSNRGIGDVPDIGIGNTAAPGVRISTQVQAPRAARLAQAFGRVVDAGEDIKEEYDTQLQGAAFKDFKKDLPGLRDAIRNDELTQEEAQRLVEKNISAMSPGKAYEKRYRELMEIELNAEFVDQQRRATNRARDEVTEGFVNSLAGVSDADEVRRKFDSLPEWADRDAVAMQAAKSAMSVGDAAGVRAIRAATGGEGHEWERIELDAVRNDRTIRSDAAKEFSDEVRQQIDAKLLDGDYIGARQAAESLPETDRLAQLNRIDQQQGRDEAKQSANISRGFDSLIDSPDITEDEVQDELNRVRLAYPDIPNDVIDGLYNRRVLSEMGPAVEDGNVPEARRLYDLLAGDDEESQTEGLKLINDAQRIFNQGSLSEWRKGKLTSMLEDATAGILRGELRIAEAFAPEVYLAEDGTTVTIQPTTQQKNAAINEARATRVSQHLEEVQSGLGRELSEAEAEDETIRALAAFSADTEYVDPELKARADSLAAGDGPGTPSQVRALEQMYALRSSHNDVYERHARGEGSVIHTAVTLMDSHNINAADALARARQLARDGISLAEINTTKEEYQKATKGLDLNAHPANKGVFDTLVSINASMMPYEKAVEQAASDIKNRMVVVDGVITKPSGVASWSAGQTNGFSNLRTLKSNAATATGVDVDDISARISPDGTITFHHTEGGYLIDGAPTWTTRDIEEHQQYQAAMRGIKRNKDFNKNQRRTQILTYVRALASPAMVPQIVTPEKVPAPIRRSPERPAISKIFSDFHAKSVPPRTTSGPYQWSF